MQKAFKVKEKRNRFTPVTIVMLVVLILFCVSFLGLIVWCVATSFKTCGEAFNIDPYGLIPNYDAYGKENPLVGVKLDILREEGNLMFYTYRNILTRFKWQVPAYPGKAEKEVNMAMMYLHSLAYAGGCGLVATVVPCMTAYCCARFKWKFSRFIHTLVIVVMMIPIVGSLPSEIRLATSLGIMNEIWGLWIMKANFLGLYFLVFYDVFKSLPASFSEAAKIDGANNFQVFFRIAMPLVKNTFFTVLLILFIQYWNDYQAAKVFMPSYPTISYYLNYVMVQSIEIDKNTLFIPSEWPARMATVVLTALPISVLFIIFQKRLLGNLTMGGVKG